MKFRIEALRGSLAVSAALALTLLAACGGQQQNPSVSEPEGEPLVSSTAQSTPLAVSTPDSVLIDDSSAPQQSTPDSTPEAPKPSAQDNAPQAPASTQSPTAFTRQSAIDAGHVVLSDKASVPCYNAQSLLGFYEDYKAGRDSEIDLYSFRTQQGGERYYSKDTLRIQNGVATMIEDTTHYYDTAAQATEAPGVTTIGTFTMSKNKYGFLVLDVEGESGVLQYHYQITGYDELYPSVKQYEEEYQRYLAPLLGTGILELDWHDPSQLLDAGLFPQAFEPLAGTSAQRSTHWSEEKKTYSFPAELVESALLSRFDVTVEQLRALSVYNAERETYDFVPHNAGQADLRLLRVTQPEESGFTPGVDESLLELRYEFYSPENGAPVSRGKLTVLLTAEDSFRYLGNELLPAPEEIES